MAVTGVRYDESDESDRVELIDTDGNAYPVCVDAANLQFFIGSGWVQQGNTEVDGYNSEYITIINADNEYENPELIPWLMQFGANFPETYGNIYLQTETGGYPANIQTLACEQDATGSWCLVIKSEIDAAIKPYTQDGDEIYNCDMQLVDSIGYEDGTCQVDINGADRNRNIYANALICKALGINPIYLK